LQTTAEYNPGENIKGVMSLNLRQGELLPASTKVILTMAGQEHIYELSELVSEEITPYEGDFYVDNKEISGTGIGYGVPGIIEDFPEISFTLNIVPVDESPQDQPQETGEESPQPSPQPPASTDNQETSDTESNDTSNNTEQSTKEINETEGSDEIITGEVSEEPEENLPTQTESPEAPTEESSTETESSQEEIPVEEQPVTEETEPPQPSPQPPASTDNQETSDTESDEQQIIEISDETLPESPDEIGEVGLTGAIVSFFAGIFVSPLTGGVISDTQIQGTVSHNSVFEYTLNEGQSVKLVQESVMLGEEVLDENIVDVEIIDNQVIVTTNYTEGAEQGFGEEYLGTEIETLEINLSKLDIESQQGELTIKLVYEETEIISSSLDLLKPGVQVISEINGTDVQEIREIKIENIEDFTLTEDEKSILIKNTGTNQVQITKAEALKNRLIVRYEIGRYWLEYSYLYTGEITDSLQAQLDLDKAKFAKKLANKFIEGEPVPENVLDLLKETEKTLPTQTESPEAPTEELSTENESIDTRNDTEI